MTLGILLFLLGAAPLAPLEVDPAVACRSSCARHVPASLMPRACGECLRKADPGAWTDAFDRTRKIPDPVVQSALSDPQWEVRWGALKARARAKRQDPAEALYAHLRAQRTAADRVVACQVAVGAGAVEEGRVLEAARKACKAVKRELRAVLESELYLPQASVQEEALRKLMLFLGEGAGRVVLTAIRDRPDAVDEVPALLLLRVARPDYPVGRLLLADADAAFQKEMNRLLAVYARQIDTLRPQLAAPEPEQRREAVEALALLFPMTRPELERALSDADDTVALAAVAALADATDRTLHEVLRERAQAWPSGQVPLEAQVRMVRQVGQVKQEGCGPPLEALFDDQRLAPEVRGAALVAQVRCNEGEVLSQLRFGLASPEPTLRVAAVRGLSEVTGQSGVYPLLDGALKDEAAEVVAAALRALGATALHGGRDRAARLLAHEAPQVRQAAAEVLAVHARPSDLTGLRDQLKAEPEPSIRVALVQALARLGGPVATAALAEVEQRDPDAYVRQAAVSGLKRMLR